MNQKLKLSAVAGLLLVGVAGCGDGGGNNGGATKLPGTGSSNVQTFIQRERLARPVVNEVLATFAGRRHYVNDVANPKDDPVELAKDIESFLTFPAGRSRPIKDAIKSVLVPDVMVADLSKAGPASYLGELAPLGGGFGGRKLQDDVVDLSTGIIFGDTVPKVFGVQDDGKEIPTLASGDNVGPEAKHYKSTFPYLGDPQ